MHAIPTAMKKISLIKAPELNKKDEIKAKETQENLLQLQTELIKEKEKEKQKVQSSNKDNNKNDNDVDNGQRTLKSSKKEME